jgi:hypothetical protein
MKTNLTLATFLLILLVTTLSQTASAQTATVGVNAGNTFIYSYTAKWESTDPAAIIPVEYAKLKDTQYVQMNIVSVEGTLINIDFTRHYKDGTETKQNGNIDVNTQVLEIPYRLLIRAGANSQEKIYPLGGHATLNDTATRTYPIGQVETIRYVSPETNEPNFEKTEIIYDKANGVGLEYNYESQEISGSYITTIKTTLVITSWVIPEFPSTAVLMLLLIAIPIVLVAYKKKWQSNHKFSVLFKA